MTIFCQITLEVMLVSTLYKSWWHKHDVLLNISVLSIIQLIYDDMVSLPVVWKTGCVYSKIEYGVDTATKFSFKLIILYYTPVSFGKFHIPYSILGLPISV